jgi:WD40 repeat protein
MKSTFLLFIALTCWTKTIQAQDLVRPKLTLQLQGKLDGVAFSPDSKLLAVTSSRITLVRLWDTNTGKLKAKFSGKELDSVRYGEVANDSNYVRFSPDGKILALISREIKEVRLWNAETGKHHMTLANLETLANATFSPDGRLLALAAGQQGLQVLDVYARQTVKTRWDYQDASQVSNADFSDDGTTLIVKIVSGKQESSGFYFLDVLTGKVKAMVPVKDNATRWVRAWNILAAIDSSNNINLIDMFGKVKNIKTGIKGQITRMAFSPDRRTIAVTSNRTVGLYDSATEAMKVALVGHEQASPFAGFSPDGKIAVTEDKKGLKIWDPFTGELKQTLNDARYPFGFSPDGSMLVTAKGMTALIWQISVR